MKVTNKTAYATIGCDVQLSENDRLALGIELDKVTNWLDSVEIPETSTELYKAINKIAAFISKFAIRPSETNVFTDSPEDFERIDKIVVPNSVADETVDTDVEQSEGSADKSTTAVEPATGDDVITVNIAKCENESLENLKQILFYSTAANRTRIKDFLRSAEESQLSCISFNCTHRPKEKVYNELVHAGYTIEPNGVNSLRL